jgi:hypothetical protein
MALLFLESFDHDGTSTSSSQDLADKWTAGTGGTRPGRHGNGCYGISATIAFDTVASSRVIVGGAWTTPVLNVGMYSLRDLSNDFATLSVQHDGRLEINMLGADGIGTSDVVARTAGDVIKTNQWFYIEWDVTVRVVLSSGNPTYYLDNVTVYVDGEAVLTGTNLGPTVAFIVPPSTYGWTRVSFSGNGVALCDDIYISDGSGGAPWNAPLGDVQIDVIRPNGNGSATDWTVSGPANNWDAVNDMTPDDNTSLVTAAVAGLSDLYALEDVATGNGIIGAQLLISARRNEEGFATLTPLLRHGGVTYELRTRTLSPSYFYRNRDVFVVMPNGDPLTDGNINALQAGMKRNS